MICRAFRMMGLLCLLSVVSIMADDDSRKLRDNKRELDRVKDQLTETKQKVDSLSRLEAELQKTISKYGERVNRNKKLVTKTERDLRIVRDELDKNNASLKDTEVRLARVRAGYTGLLVDYYRRSKSDVGFSPWEFAGVVSNWRMSHYLASISGSATREIASAGDTLKLLTQYADSLNRAGTNLAQLRKEKKAKINLDLSLKQKEETSLGSVRRQSTLLQDRLASLSAVAREMEDIIARLERDLEKRRAEEGTAARFRTGSFAQLKGSLLPPVSGKVVSSFGWKKNKNTNLSSFSPGIDIQPAAGKRIVAACAPGRVVYVGKLRGYDNFVILEHDDGYYTTYANLSTATVDLDQLLAAGDTVGKCGDGVFHFEIRQGREHLDPVLWLDLDEF